MLFYDALKNKKKIGPENADQYDSFCLIRSFSYRLICNKGFKAFSLLYRQHEHSCM